jgi:thiamine-phosphate pyrophosphorylase
VTASEPSIMLISDSRRVAGGDLPAQAREASLAGVDLFQVREKSMGVRALRALVAQVTAATEGTRTRVIVNGRPDVAVVAGAHGVQLPEEGLPIRDVRRAFPELVVGGSCHSLAGAQRAADEGADFVLLGPIFTTPGKEERALGIETLAEAARHLRVPVYAVGGVDATTASQAVAAGALGLAAIRVFLEGPLQPVVMELRGASRRGR